MQSFEDDFLLSVLRPSPHVKVEKLKYTLSDSRENGPYLLDIYQHG